MTWPSDIGVAIKAGFCSSIVSSPLLSNMHASSIALNLHSVLKLGTVEHRMADLLLRPLDKMEKLELTTNKYRSH
jgi:hypothetical protein